jgi:AsmA protein
MRLRTVLIAAGVVVALPIAGIAIFAATFDANAYKPRIAAAVKEATGRELALNGPIGLKLGLHPGVRVEDVAFANAPWGSRPEMAKLRALEVEVAILPLLSGTIQVNRVVLVSPDILLETDAEGRGNWEIAAPPRQGAPAQAAPAPPTPPPAAQPAAAQRELFVGELTITDGTIVHRDGKTRQTTTLALPRFAARTASRTSPLSLDLAAALNGNAFTLSGTVGPLARLLGTPGTAPWPVDLTLGAAGARAAVKGSVADPMTGKGFDIAVEATVPDLARLAPFVPNVELPPARDLAISVQAADRGSPVPEIRALTVRAGASDLNAIVPGLRLSRLEVAAPDTQTPVRLALAATMGGAPVSAEGTLGPLEAFLPGAGTAPWPVDLRLGAAGAQATAKGTIARPRAVQGIDLALAATIPDLAALSPLAGGAALPAIKDVTFSARASDLRSGQGAALRDIALKLGESDVEGSAEVALGARPKLTADLRSRKFDADALMAAMEGGGTAGAPPSRGGTAGAPPSRGGQTTPAPAAAPAPAQRPGAQARLIPDTPLPVAGLRAADASVRLALAELVFGGASYREAQATVALDAGRLTVDPFRVTAPGAPVSGSLSVDASTDQPPVAIVVRAPAIDLRQFLSAFGGGYRVAGTLELDMDVRGRGASPAAIASGLAGHVGLAGANLDIDNRLIDLVAGEVWRALVPGAPRDGSSNVRCLAFRFDSTAGTADARAFLFDSSLARVTGTGQLLLGPEQLRLRLVPTLRLAGGIGVPVNVGGTFLAPSVRVDAAGAVGSVVGALSGGAAGGATQGPLGGIAGALAGRQQGAAAAQPAGDDCASQLAIARGGRQGPVPAPEAVSAPAEAPTQAPAAPAQPQRPANPLQQLVPRLGR